MIDGDTDAPALRLRALGVAIDVDIVGPGAEELGVAAARAWSRCLRPAGRDAEERFVVRVDPQLPEVFLEENGLAGSSLAGILDHLSVLVTMRAIEVRSGDAILLHAAGLSDPVSGQTIALVAPSGTGKTSAATQFGRELGYVTDETVAVEVNLAVTPYEKPLSVVRAGLTFKEQVSPTDLGLAALPSKLALHRVVLLERDGGDGLRVEKRSLARSLAELAPHTSYLSHVPRPLHRLADALEQTGGLVIARYSQSEQLWPLVEDLIDRP